MIIDLRPTSNTNNYAALPSYRGAGMSKILVGTKPAQGLRHNSPPSYEMLCRDQTCTRLQVFVIHIIISKNKVADENLHFQRHTNFLVKLQCLILELWSSFFSAATLFLEGIVLNLSYPQSPYPKRIVE